jgi:hypothetical protein
MLKEVDPRETLQMIQSELPKFEQLSEKEFDGDQVKRGLEELSNEELIQLQVNMFAQYHEMARLIVEMAAALKVALQSTDV